MDKRALLKQYFGHGGFRPGQEPLIGALLSGRDTLGVMPTGAGKSVCYQLPALLLPGLALVLSPLISLMKDQVAALSQAGIPAAYLNSSLDAEEYREVCRRVRRGGVQAPVHRAGASPGRGLPPPAGGAARLPGGRGRGPLCLPVGPGLPAQLLGNCGAAALPARPAPGGGLYRHRHGGGAPGHRVPAGAPGPLAHHYRL